MNNIAEQIREKGISRVREWRNDWCKFARDGLGVMLDSEQDEALYSVQVNHRTSVTSGTSRGKDYLAAVAALCFLNLTPKWENRRLIENTKVAMTAPRDRQIKDIMVPEITRIFNNSRFKLPGRLVGYDIRTDDKEWFLTGFKADEHTHEAWTGFHAVHTMFVVTEASFLPESVADAIEGNLIGNYRILLVFNPNTRVGYAANSQRSQMWAKFRLNCLNAPNVVQKKVVIPGQVEYNSVVEKVKMWCEPIAESDYLEDEGDFWFELDGERRLFRPNDKFRVKVLGLFPKVDSGTLVPWEWIEAANKRWLEYQAAGGKPVKPLRLGVDVAGMGRDSTCFCYRFDNYVEKFEMIHSGGKANHMAVAGRATHIMKAHQRAADGLFPQEFIDTIGEGAGVYSANIETAAPGPANIQADRIHSVKFSESATNTAGKPLKDVTECYEFVNMRDFCLWSVRDWLNPINKTGAMLPPDDDLAEELMQTMWSFRRDGKVKIEQKEDIKTRIGRSPDRADSLALTFAPVPDIDGKRYTTQKTELSKMFF